MCVGLSFGLSVYPSVCTCVCLSVRPSVCISVRLSVCLSAGLCQSVFRSVYPCIRRSARVSVCPSGHQSVYQFVCLSVCLSAGLCQSVSLFVRLSLHYFDFFFTLLWHPILFNYFIYLATYAKLGSLLSLAVINSRVVIRIRIGNIRWQHPKHINIFCILLRVFVMRHCSIEINFRAERNSEILNHIVDP